MDNELDVSSLTLKELKQIIRELEIEKSKFLNLRIDVELLSEKNSKGEIIENLAIGKKQTIEGIDASILAIDKSLELFVSELNKRKSQDETKGCSSSECEPNS